jgi:hypothetical protein
MRPGAFASPDQLVRRSTVLAHADRARRVSVAGPDSLDAMVSLCRDGFDHVECARQSTCSSADEASDLLLIAGPLSPDELTGLVARTCRLVRDGGVVVVQLQRPGHDAAVRAALQARGLEIAATVFDPSAGCLVSHTVRRPAALRQAI